MKIAICGSMVFAKQMLKIKEDLKKLGHEVFVPSGVEDYADGTIAVEDKWGKIENNVIRDWFNVIKSSDAIMVT